MATTIMKRKHSAVHPERQQQVPASTHKRRKPDNLGSKSYKKARPVNELKTRIRDLTRLLARDDDKMPANIRVAKERELQAQKVELERVVEAARLSKMITRYHSVRFFDRQKATKNHKKLSNAYAADKDKLDDAARKQAEDEIYEADVDIKYAIYYPLNKPYSSLFPSSKNGDESQVTSRKRGDAEMRQLVRKCMANGQLKLLRDGKAKIGDGGGAERSREVSPISKAAPDKLRKDKHGNDAKSKSAEKKLPKQTKARSDQHADDDESDGGFFE